MNIRRVTTGLMAAVMLTSAAVPAAAVSIGTAAPETSVSASALTLSERDVRSKLYIVCKDGRKVYVGGSKGSMLSTLFVPNNYKVNNDEIAALQLEVSFDDLPDNCDATVDIGGNYCIYDSTGKNRYSYFARGSAQIPGIKKFYNVMLEINDTDVAKIDFLSEYKNVRVEKVPVDLSGAKVKGIAQTYTGKALMPATNVSLNGKTLLAGVDYTFRYSNNVEPGFGKIIVEGIGDYKGSASGTFSIQPKRVSAKKAVSASKKTAKITWKKSTHCTGFQIVMATSSDMKKNKKVVWVKKNTTTAKTVKGLKSGKKYRVKIRAYKSVGKQKIYGRYSKLLTVKVK